MSSPGVRREPLPETTQGVDAGALSNVYRFILDCRAKKKGTRPGAPDDDIKESNGYVARTNCNAS